MVCKKCNTVNNDSAETCSKCGNGLPVFAPAAPQGAASSAPEINFSNLLFSFKGRIPRSTYWLKWIIPIVVLSIIFNILDPVLGTTREIAPTSGTYIGILSIIFSLLIIYPGLAVAVKRCHDRGRSGWFILLAFVPIVNLWPAIELAFLKGTTGANKYGADLLSS